MLHRFITMISPSSLKSVLINAPRVVSHSHTIDHLLQTIKHPELRDFLSFLSAGILKK